MTHVPPYIIRARCELPVTDNSPSEETVTSWICTSKSSAEMNAKHALALIFALQVSVSLCEIPDPPEELVQKYNEYKGTFYKRLLNLLTQVQTASGPMVEQATQDGRGQVAREYAESLQAKPEFQAMVKIATALGEEASPLVDKARLKLLGAYQAYLRPYVGEWLADTITEVKVHLDKIMPAE